MHPNSNSAPTEPPAHSGAVRRFIDPHYTALQPNLAGVRDGIDGLDEQIVALLAQRAALVKDATRFKLNAHQAAAPARQAQVFDRVRALARSHGAVAHDFEGVVETTYRAMVAAFIAREQHHLGETEPI